MFSLLFAVMLNNILAYTVCPLHIIESFLKVALLSHHALWTYLWKLLFVACLGQESTSKIFYSSCYTHMFSLKEKSNTVIYRIALVRRAILASRLDFLIGKRITITKIKTTAQSHESKQFNLMGNSDIIAGRRMFHCSKIIIR